MALLNYLVAILSFKAGMHNIRPAGQMWPAKPCDLARKALNFVYFACFFDKNTL